VTTTFMAPTLLKMLLSLPKQVQTKYDVSSIKSLIVGAAACPMQIKEGIMSWFGPVLYEFYGSAELGVSNILQPQDQLARPGSCGRIIEGYEIRIIDEKTLKDVPRGSPGLIFIRRTQNMISEYHNSPDKTKELFNTLDGWASVGDIGRLDNDNYLYILDRAIDMIISAGTNIYPAEIEDVLHRHPAILDVAVFGVPDEHWGESVHAAIVLHDGQNATEKEILDFARKHLASFKVPRHVSFHSIDDFPRDSAGKVQKRKLRDAYSKSVRSKL